ncbi:MAG: frataxin domain-containing protein [Pseudomonadota bacterium]
MEYSIFTKLASEEIRTIYDIVEKSLLNGDCDLINEVLYIYTDKGDYVINQHGPTSQIWLSSPISNAGYFNYDPKTKEWLDKNNKSLRKRLEEDLIPNLSYNWAFRI